MPTLPTKAIFLPAEPSAHLAVYTWLISLMDRGIRTDPDMLLTEKDPGNG